jgi:KDO2-lipid IV(A) lauroyltransferase
MKDYVLYIIVRGAILFLRIFPLKFWLGLARLIGWFYYYVAGKKNKRAWAHLKLALGERSKKERKKIIHSMYVRFAQDCFETLYLPYLNEAYILKHVQSPGLSSIQEAVAAPGGSVFLACHAGSWELTNIINPIFFKSRTYAMLAQPQARYKKLDAFLNILRESKETKVISVSELKKVVSHLSSGNILGVVADHGGRDGIAVDFFGKLAMTPVGGVKLARKLKAKIFLGMMHRISGPNHEISFKPYELVTGGDEEKDLKVNLTRINKIFEEYVRQYPEEYLWFFKRWKYSPEKNILVLSDGKSGHVKQSLALCAILEGHWGKKITTKVVDVRYKTALHRNLLAWGTWMGGARLSRGLLPYCLTDTSFQNVDSGAYDMVVSSGSSLAAVNVAVALDNNAKAISVMKPGILPFKKFDVVIVPVHDQVSKYPHVIEMIGSLNAVTPESLKSDFSELCKRRKELCDCPSHPGPKIGFLIGGDSKHYSLNADMLEVVCGQLKMIQKEKNASLFLTTSRRTSLENTQVLKNNFINDSGCKLFVEAAVDNPLGTVGGIFYLSDVIVVSGESISMVSEALASGKAVIVFKPRALKENNKVKRFLDFLSQKNYISLVAPADIACVIKKILDHSSPRVVLDERESVFEELKKIL